LTLDEIALALKSPDARVESSAIYHNKRGIKGYRTRIRSGNHWLMLSIPHTDHAVELREIAAALSSPDASITLEGCYENRVGCEGYHATIFSGQRWYLISVSEAPQIEVIQNPTGNSPSSVGDSAIDQQVDQFSVGQDFIWVIGRIVELLSEETKEAAAEFLLEQATAGFYVPTEERTESFFTSLLEQLDAIASELRKDPDDLVDAIENTEQYFPQDEEVSAIVRDDYRLRGLLFQLLEREPSLPLGRRLRGLNFRHGIRELKALFTESRHFIVHGRGVLRKLSIE
jgi:hypothetical protein